MKMLYRMLTAGILLVFSALSPVFAEGDISFENEISTDTFLIGKTFNENRRFGGIEERVQLEYTGDKIDANGNISFRIRGETVELEEGKKLRADFSYLFLHDSYIKFRPIEKLQLALAADDGTEKAKGSYFPALEHHAGLGNYTGNLGVLFKPVQGLSVGAGINLKNDIFNNVTDDLNQIWLNFGAEYELKDIGAISLTVNDIINNFSIGAYAGFSAVKDMDIYAGFAFQRNVANLVPVLMFSNFYNDFIKGIDGMILLSGGLEYKGIEGLSLAADLATNCFVKADYSYDIYTGLRAGYEVNESFAIDGKFCLLLDLMDSRNNQYHDYRYSASVFLSPEVVFNQGNNTFKAGFKMEFCGGNFCAAIPLSWKYSF